MSGLALVDAHVHPMTTPEARATAIAWKDGVILAVGDDDTIRNVAEAHDLPVEALEGRVVVPGFVDAHMHFLHVGVKRLRPDLRKATSLDEAAERTRAWLADHPGDAPVIAEGWDESPWPEARFPTKADLDAIAPDRPLVWRRIDGHVAVANSHALALVRPRWDDDALVDLGSGLLLEDASLYLNEVIPVPPQDLDEALQQATAVAHRRGVTAVGEYAQAPFRQAYLRAAKKGTLGLRVACSIYVQQLEDEAAAGFRTAQERSPWLRDGGVKVFLDGSFGGRTAYMREPYQDADDPGHRGEPNWSDEELLRWFRSADAAGIQIHAHAIGDAAIDQGLDAFEDVVATPGRRETWARSPVSGRLPRSRQQDQQGRRTGAAATTAEAATATSGDPVAGIAVRRSGAEDPDPAASKAGRRPAGPHGPPNPLRHRFEHYELPHDDALERTVAAGILACAQPNFVGAWSTKGGMYERRIGPAFWLNNRYRTFLDAGLDLCFGSDGMPFGPLAGIQAAIDHPVEEERLSAAQAVWLYTHRAAWAIHWEDAIGTLETGKQADLLVLDIPDLEAAQPKEWPIERVFAAGTRSPHVTATSGDPL